MKNTLMVLVAMIFVSLNAHARVPVRCDDVSLSMSSISFGDGINDAANAYDAVKNILEDKGYHITHVNGDESGFNTLYLSLVRSTRDDSMALLDSYSVSAYYESSKGGVFNSFTYHTPDRKAGLVSYFLFKQFAVNRFSELPNCSEIGNYLKKLSH